MTILTAEYQPLVASARARLTNDPRLAAMLAPHLEPAVLHRFLIQFSAWGVRLTEPVDGWIRRAGARCITCGYQTLGQALVWHAQDEAGHHLMFLNDLEYLLARWQAQGYEPLTADALLAMPSSMAMQRYIDLHETAITSDEPFVQIAIEYEIESMATSLGPRMVRQCLHVLGPESAQGLSFVEE